MIRSLLTRLLHLSLHLHRKFYLLDAVSPSFRSSIFRPPMHAAIARLHFSALPWIMHPLPNRLAYMSPPSLNETDPFPDPPRATQHLYSPVRIFRQSQNPAFTSPTIADPFLFLLCSGHLAQEPECRIWHIHVFSSLHHTSIRPFCWFVSDSVAVCLVLVVPAAIVSLSTAIGRSCCFCGGFCFAI